jgi:hypothetical protein
VSHGERCEKETDDRLACFTRVASWGVFILGPHQTVSALLSVLPWIKARRLTFGRAKSWCVSECECVC